MSDEPEATPPVPGDTEPTAATPEASAPAPEALAQAEEPPAGDAPVAEEAASSAAAEPAAAVPEPAEVPAPAPEPERAEAPAPEVPSPEPAEAQPAETAAAATEAEPAPAPEPEPAPAEPAEAEAAAAAAPQAAEAQSSAPDADASTAAEPEPEAETAAAAPQAAEAQSSAPDADASTAAEPEPEAEAPAAEPQAAEAQSSAPTPEADPAAAASADAAAPVAATPPAPGPEPKPGEPGYDPDQGLGLAAGTTALGPPNMGGFESGEIVTGTVLTVNRREAEVDLGNGKVGVIGERHWSSGDQVDLTTVLKTGDSVDAAVLARADARKRITLSHLWAQQKRGWEAAETAAKDKGNLTGTVTETVKGGLSLDVNGIRGFMPASLVDVTTVNDLKPYVGQTFEVRVIEADRTKQRLIVSRKAAMRASQRQQAKQALTGIEVGQQLKGTVAQITDFGAFVDVEGVRGLVHKSEIGWSRSRDPQRDLTVGQEVDVTVIRVQPSRNRLGLSMKAGEDPLKTIRRGDRYEGTVTRLVDFGAFVQLPGDVEGLVHVSEMAEYRVFAPEEIVIPGEKVAVKVLKVDKKRRTIDLSMAQAVVPDPPDEAAAIAAANAAAEAATDTAASDAPADTEAAAGEAADTEVTEADSPDTAAEAVPVADDDYAEDQAGTAAGTADDAPAAASDGQAEAGSVASSEEE